MCAKIVCTPRDKDGNLRGYSGKNEKPPSLAGVEKFIRAKIAAAAAAAVPSTRAPPMIPNALLSKVFPPGALNPGPSLAPTIAEIGGGASKTNPASMDGLPTAEPASPSPQHATDAPQLPPPEVPVVTASDN